MRYVVQSTSRQVPPNVGGTSALRLVWYTGTLGIRQRREGVVYGTLPGAYPTGTMVLGPIGRSGQTGTGTSLYQFKAKYQFDTL